MTSYRGGGGSLETSFGQGGGYVFSGQNVTRKLFAPLPKKKKVNLKSLWYWYEQNERDLDLLPKNLKSAEFHLKMSRLGFPVFLVTFLQMCSIFLFSLFLPQYQCQFPTRFTFGLGVVCNSFVTFLNSIFSISFVLLTVPLLFIVTLLARFISGPKKIDNKSRLKLGPWTLRSLVWNPTVLAILVVGYFLLFITHVDPDYSGFGLYLPSTPEESVAREQLLVIQLIIFFAAVEFFADNLQNGQFIMDMPTNHVKWTLIPLLLWEVKKNFKTSIVLGFSVWAGYVFIGRPLCVFLVDPMYKDDTFLENVFHFLQHFVFNPGFLKRILLYSLMTRISLRLYLRIVSREVSERSNLPLASPPATAEPLLLFDAMKCDNSFLKHVAFAQYYSKADVVDIDTMAFFQLSHPGNHPIYWRTAFSICSNLLAETNMKILSTFSSTAKLPMQLERIRLSSNNPSDKNSNPSGQTASTTLNEAANRRSLMRDLATLSNEDPPQDKQTLVDLAKTEFWKAWEDFQNIPKALGGYVLRSLLSAPDVLPYPLAIAKIPEEVDINNLLYDHMLVYWAMMGTMKLFCCSLHGKFVDPRNVVFKDVNSFLKIMVDLYRSLIYMETYLDHMLELYPTVNKELLEHHKKLASRLSNASVMVLMEIHYKFSPFYDIIGVPVQRHRVINEILGCSGL